MPDEQKPPEKTPEEIIASFNASVETVPPPTTVDTTATEVIETSQEDTEKEDRRNFLIEEIGKILKEYGGLESNIPANAQTNYWHYQNELRTLVRKY